MSSVRALIRFFFVVIISCPAPPFFNLHDLCFFSKSYFYALSTFYRFLLADYIDVLSGVVLVSPHPNSSLGLSGGLFFALAPL